MQTTFKSVISWLFTPLQTAKLPKQKLKKLFTFLSLPFCSNFWQRPTFFQSDEHSRPSSEHYSLLSSSEEDEELVPLRKHSVSFIKIIGLVMKTFAKSPKQIFFLVKGQLILE